MIRLSQLIGQRVVARANGQQVGSIRRVMLDPARGAITAAQLESPIGGAVVLEWSRVVAIDTDSVMIEADDAPAPAEGEREQRLVVGELELLGKNVLTDEGVSLGALEDLEFDERSGRIARLHVPGQALPARRFLALGPDALIIAATTATSTAASAR